MTVKRYTLRLYRYSTLRSQIDEYLDPTDTARLRELLIARVQDKVGKRINMPLDRGWELQVLAAGGGQRYCRVTVDRAGRTVVKRP